MELQALKARQPGGHDSQLMCDMVRLVLCPSLGLIAVTQPPQLVPCSCPDSLMITATVHAGSLCFSITLLVAPFKVAVGAETQKKWQMCWEKVIEAEMVIL